MYHIALAVLCENFSFETCECLAAVSFGNVSHAERVYT